MRWHQKWYQTVPPKMFENPVNKARCPVRLYKLYESKRPKQCTETCFFLGINYQAKQHGEWYINKPMGPTRIGEIMSKIAERAGLVGKYTNHSVRRTMCTQLYQKGVNPILIAQLSGHKNINSLSHYTTASMKQQHEMSAILQGNSETSSICAPWQPPAALGKPPENALAPAEMSQDSEYPEEDIQAPSLTQTQTQLLTCHVLKSPKALSKGCSPVQISTGWWPLTSRDSSSR